MPNSHARVGILALVTMTVGCSTGRIPVYVAPSNETIESGTEMNYGGDGQFVYVINHASAAITITGLHLIDCENIKNRCEAMQLRVPVPPGARENLITVKPDNPGRAYSFRFIYTWAPARAKVTVPIAVTTRPDTLGPPPAVDPRMAAFMNRSDSLAALVDTIVVLHPDSIILHVGQSVELSDSVQWEGRRASGERLPGIGAFMSIENTSIAQTMEAGLTGLRVGHTRLVLTVISRKAHAPPSYVPVRVMP